MRYVVLHHTDWPNHPDHYDLMLQTAEGSENDRALLTFSSQDNIFPDGLTGNSLSLNEPHRLAYLNSEGAVSGGRGVVKRVDCGEILEFHRLKHNVWFMFNIEGGRLNGRYEITLTSSRQYLMKKID